jgi:pimeloyl-ACP methyl ester carboxylesterase
MGSIGTGMNCPLRRLDFENQLATPEPAGSVALPGSRRKTRGSRVFWPTDQQTPGSADPRSAKSDSDITIVTRFVRAEITLSSGPGHVGVSGGWHARHRRGILFLGGAPMTIVLVHGNPETEAIWDDLVPHLHDDDIVRLSPPGFGSAIPPGFDCSVDAYRDWLEDELEKFTHPVDLVGHDWGGGFVMRIAIDRPDLIRSWTSDILGAFDGDYVWHDLARIWQTPEIGEQAVAQVAGMPVNARAQQFESLGMTSAIGRKVAAGANADIGKAILALYRSAAQPVMRDFGNDLPRAAAKPGLALIATEDPYCGGEKLARRCATRAGAKAAVLEGAGHWWMCQQPKQGADAINAFLAKLN